MGRGRDFGEAALQAASLILFAEHHGKGRNDGASGLQRSWVDEVTRTRVIEESRDFSAALQERAAETMRWDPTPLGPECDVVPRDPSRPAR